MQVIYMSRLEAERFDNDKNYIIISITDPNQPVAQLEKSNNCNGILRQKFYDIDVPVKGYKLMDSYQADEIATFVKNHKDFVDIIIVHCEAGISRSAGIAMAINEWIHYVVFSYPIYNRHCYRLMKEAIERIL